ncbi:MAG: GAF domain-containing protein [Armatimonadota bacterium]|jgi:signal transduction histidine kinase/uncharacterized protein YigA (DUF484 family)
MTATPGDEAAASAETNQGMLTGSDPTDPDRTLTAIVEQATAAICARGSGLLLAGRSDAGLYLAAHHGLPDTVLRALTAGGPERELCQRALESAEPVLLDGTAAASDGGSGRLAGVALSANDGVQGVLLAVAADGEGFGEGDLPRLQSLGQLVGAAVGSAMESAPLAELNARLTALADTGRHVVNSLSLDAVLATIVQYAARLLGADSASIRLLDEHGTELELAQGYNLSEQYKAKGRLSIGESIAGMVAETHDPIAVPDISADERPVRKDLALAEGLQALCCVPLIAREHCTGVLTIYSKQPRDYAPQDVMLLEMFASQAAAAIENARLHEDLARRLSALHTLYELGRRTTSSLDLDETLKAIVSGVRESVGFDRAGVFLVDEAASVVRGRIGTDGSGNIEDISHGVYPLDEGDSIFADLVLGKRDIFLTENAWEDVPTSMRRYMDEGVTQNAILPLRAQGKVIGALSVDNLITQRLFGEDSLELLTAFADQAAVAIDRAGLHAQMEQSLAAMHSALRISRAITGTLELQKTLRLIVQSVARVMKAERTVIALLGESSERFEEVVVAAGDGQLVQEPLDSSMQGVPWTVIRRGTLVQAGVGEDAPPELAPEDEALGIQKAVGVPLKVNNEVIGGLLVKSGSTLGFTGPQLRVLTLLVHHAAIAVQNARLFEGKARAYDELRQAQQQLLQSERLRALGEIASGVAHDFNNSLAAILGHTELMLSASPEGTARTRLEIIDQAAHDAAATVRRIQDFARVGPRGDFLRVDLNEVVTDAVALTQPKWRDEAEAQGKRIQAVTDLGAHALVDGNAADLRSVLSNLIINAVDAMPEGGTVTVRTRRCESTAVITVSDTGMGMSEEDIARIFDPFFSTKGEGGLGLGLTVAYATVAAHGGSISVESEEGAGTTFHISLPAISTVEDEPADAAVATAGRVRILVADDEAHVRSALIDALRADGHQVTECASGREAVALLGQETFDLVLTDLGMPGVTGWDVAKAARASGNDPAVVLLTGWGDSITPEKLSRHGVQAVLAKPCRFAELRRVLTKVTA